MLGSLPKDNITLILNQLDDKELIHVCHSNSKLLNFCNTNDSFWRNRIMVRYPNLKLSELNMYRGSRSWNEYYIKTFVKNPQMVRNDIKFIRFDDDIRKDAKLGYIRTYGNLIYDDLKLKSSNTSSNTSYITLLCKNIRDRFKDVFGDEDYGDKLVTALFNPDIGAFALFDREEYYNIKEEFDMEEFEDEEDIEDIEDEEDIDLLHQNFLHQNLDFDNISESTRLKARAVELILTKIDNPNDFEYFYNTWLSENPRSVEGVSQTVELTESDKDLLDDYIIHNYPLNKHNDIELSEDEYMLLTVFLSKLATGEFSPNINLEDACKYFYL